MMLERTQQWLDCIRRYFPRLKLAGVRLKHSHALARRNKENARAFCHVECGDKVIHCAGAIEMLDDREIVGSLLHEIGHVVLGCDLEPDDEVAVDEWVRNIAPDSGYTYVTVKYISKINGPIRTATHIESVSQEFVNKLKKA